MTILWTGSPKLFRLAACLRSESVRVPSRSSYWMKFKFGWPNHRSCLASNLCCDGITIWGPYVQWGSGFSMLRWISRVGGWACLCSARRLVRAVFDQQANLREVGCRPDQSGGAEVVVRADVGTFFDQELHGVQRPGDGGVHQGGCSAFVLGVGVRCCAHEGAQPGKVV